MVDGVCLERVLTQYTGLSLVRVDRILYEVTVDFRIDTESIYGRPYSVCLGRGRTTTVWSLLRLCGTRPGLNHDLDGLDRGRTLCLILSPVSVGYGNRMVGENPRTYQSRQNSSIGFYDLKRRRSRDPLPPRERSNYK